MKGNLPAWFAQVPPEPAAMAKMEALLGGLNLHTVCDSAHCPNAGECFSRGTATFLILGDVCTRNCTFCAVTKGTPPLVDEEEPQRLVEAARRLKLEYVVITSVTRDDLPDGGAAHFAEAVNLLHRHLPGTKVELLVPDFQGSRQAVETVLRSSPEVLGHNVETVPRLYKEVRPMADYERSVRLLAEAKDIDPNIVTKSGLMLGLGETGGEVIEVMRDLREAGCDLLTLGQYLQPSTKHHPVARYLPPEEFTSYEAAGRGMGFAGVAAAPPVRSSFRAEKMYRAAIAKKTGGDHVRE
jgi:lipoic acid synthetase